MKIGLAVAMTGGMVVGLGDACHWSAGLVCQPFSAFVQGQAFLGNILALVGAWCAAGYLLIGRRVRPRLSLSSYTFSVYGVTTIVLLLLVAAFRLPLTGYSPVTYGWFLALALVPQLLGHTLYNWALRYLPAAYVSLGILGEPIGTVMLAYLFLREAPTLLEVAGGVMILGGIALATRLSKASDVPVDALE
jgi:drug/metabolite transporter (DMT)-like permease